MQHGVLPRTKRRTSRMMDAILATANVILYARHLEHADEISTETLIINVHLALIPCLRLHPSVVCLQ